MWLHRQYTHLRHSLPSHRRLDDRTYIQVGGVHLFSPLAFAKPRLPCLAHPPWMISGVFSSHSHLVFCGTQVLFDRLSSWASDVSPVDSDSTTFAAVALLHGVVSTHSSGPTSITLQRGVHSFYTVRDGLHMELSSSSSPHSFVFSSLFSISR